MKIRISESNVFELTESASSFPFCLHLAVSKHLYWQVTLQTSKLIPCYCVANRTFNILLKLENGYEILVVHVC